MKIKSIMLILMILMSTIGIASADTVQVIKTQYPNFIAQFGFGEVLYKTTNNAGEVSYQLSRNGFNSLSIVSMVPAIIYAEPGDTVYFSFKVTGCCRGLDGGEYHTHRMDLYNDITGVRIDSKSYNVIDGTSQSWSFNLGQFNTAGTYKYKIKEYIELWTGETPTSYIWASGNTIYVTVQVGTLPTTATIVFESTPTSATVKMGGTTIGTTPFTKTFTVGESITVEFSKSGYISQTFSFITASGTIHPTLTASTPTPTVTIPIPTVTIPTPTVTIPTPTICSDGTAYNLCSSTKPKYCSAGSLIDKASSCGCPTGQVVSGDTCIVSPLSCDKGQIIINGKCVQILPKFLSGFEILFAIIGIIGMSLLMRQNKK